MGIRKGILKVDFSNLTRAQKVVFDVGQDAAEVEHNVSFESTGNAAPIFGDIATCNQYLRNGLSATMDKFPARRQI
jgi:hypothetical protein